MAEYSAIALQTINPGETAIFTETVEPCRMGIIRHREGTGNFLVSGMNRRFSRCCCQSNSTDYNVSFGANIAIPTGGTVDAISVAITVDGTTVPASTMIVTPAAVEEFFNVNRDMSIDIWNGCCETIAVRNTSDQPILMQNANIRITR